MLFQFISSSLGYSLYFARSPKQPMPTKSPEPNGLPKTEDELREWISDEAALKRPYDCEGGTPIEYPDRGPPMRVSFTLGGCNIHGRPRTGGVWTKAGASLVDLDYLGLDRFTPVKSSKNASDEEGFVRKLRMLGAEFRKSVDHPFYDGVSRSMGKAVTLIRWIGLLRNGGILVLEYDLAEDDVPSNLGLLKMCVTMEERCRMMEQFGAKFYERPADCPLFSDLFESADTGP